MTQIYAIAATETGDKLSGRDSIILSSDRTGALTMSQEDMNLFIPD